MTTLPTTKHALVIQGSEEDKKQACIEIRDWAVINDIPIYTEFKILGYDPLQPVILWKENWLDKFILFRATMPSIEYLKICTIHHTVDSFKKVFEVEESEPTNLPIEFVEWYSGMTREKILKAVERWEKESITQEFNPIELTNPKN